MGVKTWNMWLCLILPMTHIQHQNRSWVHIGISVLWIQGSWPAQHSFRNGGHTLSAVSKDSKHGACFPDQWWVGRLILEMVTSQQKQRLYRLHKILLFSKKTVQLSHEDWVSIFLLCSNLETGLLFTTECVMITMSWQWESLEKSSLHIALCTGPSREENCIETHASFDLTTTLQSTMLSKSTYNVGGVE